MNEKRFGFDEFSKIIIDILNEEDGINTGRILYIFREKTGKDYDRDVIRQKLHRMVDEGLIKSTYDIKGYKWWKNDENERFKWEDVYKWGVPAFLEVMNGLDKKNQRLKEENKKLKQDMNEMFIRERDARNELRDIKKENEQLKREKERYKRLSEIRDENINNRILSLKEFINNCEDEKVKNALEDLFYSEVKEYDLAKENRKLKEEKEFWKGDACNCSNYLSILSMDCQIVQEAICDLKKVIDVDTEASKLLDELDDKFDDLNQHRLRVGYYTGISKRYCKDCKNLGLDGMFGMICDVNGNNKNYNCPKYEEKKMTLDEFKKLLL